MKAEYRKLGEIIELIDERNKSLVTSEVLGISIDKEFMPSVANTIGTDLSKYKLIKKNTFACNPMHVGRDERLPVALYKGEEPVIVSPAYFMFKVKNKNQVLPDFLMLLFRREDFDRNCWFRTDGSVRGGITWEALCEIELPIPAIEVQQKIVDSYNAITKRIQIKQKINENLEKTAQTIYKKMFVETADKNWKKCELGEIVEIKRGGSPRPIRDYISNDGYRWLKISDATSSNSPFIFKTEEFIKKEGLKNTVFLKSGSLVLSNSATPGLPKILKVDTCIHDGWLYFPKSFFSNEYLYLLFQSIRDELKSLGNGSIFTNLKTDILKQYKIFVPDEAKLKEFQRIIEPIFNQLLNNSKEIEQLELIKQSVISRISGM